MSLSKYRNKRTPVDGIMFASKREAGRYVALKLLLKTGRIKELELQPRFIFTINGTKICEYRADFRYQELDHGAWLGVVEDAKGMLTSVYRLKRKLMKAIHGISIRET